MKIKHITEERETARQIAPSLLGRQNHPGTESAEPMIVPNEIYKIAEIIKADWKNIYFGAVPYLDAMSSIESIDSDYYEDSAESIVSYFLANAQAWRGQTARSVKAKLKELISKAN
ncbi:hypothetical protein ACS126_03535 [Sphingobacterium lactis]|uniref:hypothetical protein n=1 Tax=Sphingobacterium TaxID=28453 RepID=UPI0021A27D4C|nr:hypothetical protein [Sphingobacterium hotanense]MCT1526081.1 hypothetical protein [Sphingobacterium hotanense]